MGQTGRNLQHEGSSAGGCLYDQSLLTLIFGREQGFFRSLNTEHHRKCNHLFLGPLSTFPEKSGIPELICGETNRMTPPPGWR